MQSCLGITVTDKLIKYAKVENTNNTFKVISYGIKFYDNLELQSTIQQIINETDSQRTPISVNVRKEKYYYFDIFSLTNKDYAKKAIQTEFESFCADNHITTNAYEGRYTYVKDQNNDDQNKVIYIYDSKADINETMDLFRGAKVTSATPTAIALPNIATIDKSKNTMIVDLDEQIKVTTVLGQSIYNVDILQQGLSEAFDTINEKENSYLKTYETLKNTTIYTMEMTNTDADSKQKNEYLQFVIPVLYKVANEVQNLMKSYKKIDKIYLTGMGTVINNVDLYFQEYFKDTKVEILKPFFIDNDPKTNAKDYIEVNSAIALAIQGLGFGIKTVNFRSKDAKESLKALLSMDIKDVKNIKISSPKGKLQKPKLNIDFNMRGKFQKMEVSAVRDCVVIVLVLILFCAGSLFLKKQIETSIAKTNDVITYTEEQIELAEADDGRINTKTQDYKKYKSNLENTSSAIETKRSRKNQITTLLNKIVYTIPKQVQLTEIKNTEVTDSGATVQHIIIQAQSTEYEQLAYFKAKLKNEGILDNVVSTEGTKEGSYVKIVIEGDLKSY